MRLLVICLVMFSLSFGAAAAPFTFAVLGDTQDDSAEGQRELAALLERIDAEQPAFVVHLGELKGGSAPCTDAYYTRIRTTLDDVRAPVIYLPGDNDWTDCRKTPPKARLQHLRKILYPEGETLGRSPLSLTRQSRAFPENVRWVYAGVPFVTFHTVGSNNNMLNSAPALEEFLSRDAANRDWLEQQGAVLREAPLLVLMTHANIQFDARPWLPNGFDRVREQMIGMVRAFEKPVLFIHGDSHSFKIDRPVKNPDGTTLRNLMRLEGFGTPDLGAILVTVDPGAPDMPFSFRTLVIH